MQFTYPPPKGDLTLQMERSLGDFSRSLPNGGICSDEEKERLRALLLTEIDSDKHNSVFAVDYGYIGPIKYRNEDVTKDVFFTIISIKDVETKMSDITVRTANKIMICYTDFDLYGDVVWVNVGDGPLHEHHLIDNVRHAICDVRMYEEYLREIETAIPDTDLHGILDI